jgi:hypothetical protein
MILANNHSTKLGTLICSAHARTVRPTGADRLDRGPSGLRAGQSAGSFWCQTELHLCISVLVNIACTNTTVSESGVEGEGPMVAT